MSKADEAKFKMHFVAGLKRDYPDSFSWANSDKFRHGLPDRMILWRGKTFAAEMKFVSKLPKKDSSLVLKHLVTPAQVSFLNSVKAAGHTAFVIIGMEGVAAVMTDIKTNYTLAEVKAARLIGAEGNRWSVKGLLDDETKVLL